MKKTRIGNVLILLVCLAVPVLAMSACTTQGGQPGETKQVSYSTPESGGNAPAEKTPVPAQKETPGPSGTAKPSETEYVQETEQPAETEGPSATVEAPDTGDPAGTPAPSETDALSGTDGNTPGEESTPAPSGDTPDPATATPGEVSATKDPRDGKTPEPTGQVKNTEKPKETETATEPTPTPGGIIIDENGNIILPEIPNT
jgi:hypothetical protein